MKLRELHDKIEFESTMRLFFKKDSACTPFFKTDEIPEFIMDREVISFWAREEDELWITLEGYGYR